MLANISNGLADRQDKFWRGDKGIDFCIVPFNAPEAPAYIFMPAQLVMCYSSLISAIALPDPLAASLGRKEKWTKGPETPQLLCFFIQVDIWQQGFAAFQKPMSWNPMRYQGLCLPHWASEHGGRALGTEIGNTGDVFVFCLFPDAGRSYSYLGPSLWDCWAF